MLLQTNTEIIVGPRVGKWHKLAEAIRRGCTIFPNQAFGGYYDSMAACAMGAAAAIMRQEPIGIDCPESRTCPVRSDCNLMADLDCPQNIVVHLNDDHRWTREAIADWLETL